MYRPFVFVGISALLASFALLKSLPLAVVYLIFAALITILVVSFKKENLNKGVIIALIFIVLIVRMISLGLTISDKTQKLAGRSADIVGEIIETDYNSDNFASLSVKVTESSIGEAEGIKMKLTLMSSTSALPGDVIKASVSFDIQNEKYRARNFSDGYYFSGKVNKIYSCRTEGFSVWRIIYNVRTAISSAIDFNGRDEQSAVLKALIIGDKSEISEEFSASVRNAGVSHMLVVSGMHLGVVCGVLMNLINRRTKLWVSVLIGVFASVFILVVCLFHVSILRAGIAYIVMLLARILKRNSDPLSALGFGVAVAVLLLPYIFYNVAFLLSVSATFGVIYPARLLIKAVTFKKFGRIGRVFRYIYDILAISVCTIFCTLPIVVTCFGYVALAAPITNLAVTLVINLALIFGVLAVILFFLPFGKYLSVPVFLISRALAGIFISAVEFIGKDGFGVVFVEEDKNIYCFFITVAFILLVRILCGYLTSKGKEKINAER